MTDHIEKLLEYFINRKEHHAYRRDNQSDLFSLTEGFRKEELPDLERAVRRLEYMLENEQPVVLPDEKIALIRTLTYLPEMFTGDEMENLRKSHYIHEQGKVCNINPSYMELISVGFDAKRSEIEHEIEARSKCGEQEEILFLLSLLRVMDAMEAFAARYRNEALRVGNKQVADVFLKIPKHAPSGFLEALQFFRLVHYCLWCSFNYHNTIGRFDQYMLPYLEKDLINGVLTQEQALELLEEFFISFNKDSDLYTGMQQGDNGQSMVLGGLGADRSVSYNFLSDLCLDASLELKLIDPKINLRVNSRTPLPLYEKGTLLTKQGLGFPQYSNDDIVIPALLRWGYDEDDAYNYVVAACWEFIIPGKGMDIPNIDGLSFADVVIKSLPGLSDSPTFEIFLKAVEEEITAVCRQMVQKYRNVYMEPSPLMSLMMSGCVRNASDISKGCRYNNYGIHGTGLSTAVDSLAAIQKYIYQDKSVTPALLLDALHKNFEGYEILGNRLRYEGPKMGNDDDQVDRIACQLLGWFADALEGCSNDRGGIYRAGTGSAMYYIWHAKSVGATPDGRRDGEALACNYSPSLFSRCSGPVSIIKSFSKPDLVKTANGGPLTIELHDTVFRSQESIRKVAMFVKSFMDMGGHQMQINAVSRDTLMDAKRHPEDHRNLIVRVWGWSGYFVELDEVYQDHIINRMELSIEG